MRGGEQHLLHLQLVLRRRRAHRLLQLRRQPRAAEPRRPEPPDLRHAPVPVAELRPGRPTPSDIDAAGGAPAGRRPELPDELEQPAGAGLQHRLLVALPVTAARRPHQVADRRRQEGQPPGADQRHGGCRDGRPAWGRGGALDPEGDRHAAGRATLACRPALQQLAGLGRAGAHRIDRNRDGVYEHGRAIRIMDAWWPRLLEAEFKPTLGEALFNRIRFLHDAPGRLGSAFNESSYGYVHKDLRDLLGNCPGRPTRASTAGRAT